MKLCSRLERVKVHTLASPLFKPFDVGSQLLLSGRNVRTQLTNLSYTENCWDLKALALSRYLLSKEVSFSHPTPLKRDLIPEDVSHVGGGGRGLSLIISPTRDRMGLAPWREVQSLRERNEHPTLLPVLWYALWLYRAMFLKQGFTEHRYDFRAK
jgi:hypothetical protein